MRSSSLYILLYAATIHKSLINHLLFAVPFSLVSGQAHVSSPPSQMAGCARSDLSQRLFGKVSRIQSSADTATTSTPVESIEPDSFMDSSLVTARTDKKDNAKSYSDSKARQYYSSHFVIFPWSIFVSSNSVVVEQSLGSDCCHHVTVFTQSHRDAARYR